MCVYKSIYVYIYISISIYLSIHLYITRRIQPVYTQPPTPQSFLEANWAELFVTDLLYGLLLPASVDGLSPVVQPLRAADQQRLAQRQDAGEDLAPGHHLRQRRPLLPPHHHRPQQVLQAQLRRQHSVFTEVRAARAACRH